MWPLGIPQRPALKGKFIFPVASGEQREMKRVEMVAWLRFLEDAWAAQHQHVGTWSLTLTAPTSSARQFLSI